MKNPADTRPDDGQGGDEIDLIGLALLVWRLKIWIAAGTVLASAFGLFLAMTATSVYRATAIITPKDANKGGNNPLAGKLGGLGGIMGLQMGSGNTSLDRIDIILKGHELAAAVIDKNDLMPKLFPALWDQKANAWRVKDSTRIPNRRIAIEILRNTRLSVTPDLRKNIIHLSVNMHDSLLAKEMVEYYLDALNDRLFQDAKKEAETNRAYLESQMMTTADPMMKEKISNLISFEIEKYLLVNSQSFDILERPVVPMERLSPRKKIILMTWFFAGLLASTTGALMFLFLKKSIAVRAAARR